MSSDHKFILHRDDEAFQIKNRNISTLPNHQVVYVTFEVKAVKAGRSFFPFKIGKSKTDETGHMIRENETNQHRPADYKSLIIVCPEGHGHSEAVALEKHLREELRGQLDFQAIPDARVFRAVGREWTEYHSDKSFEDAYCQLVEIVTHLCYQYANSKEGVCSNLPKFSACVDEKLFDEICRKFLDNSTGSREKLLVLPTGLGKEALTLNLLLKDAELREKTLLSLWNCPSPLNDILSEVRKWYEFDRHISVYSRDGNNMERKHKAPDEKVRLYIVSLPAMKNNAAKSSSTDDLCVPDDENIWDLGNVASEDDDNEYISNAIEAIASEVGANTQYGALDVIVQDESHEAYDTSKTHSVLRKLRGMGVTNEDTRTLRKSATDIDAISRMNAKDMVVRTLMDKYEEMVKSDRWPSISIANISPATRDLLDQNGWDSEEIEKALASQDPRDWSTVASRAFLECLLADRPASHDVWKKNPPPSRFYSDERGVFLVLVEQVKDAQALYESFEGEREPAGVGWAKRCEVNGKPSAMVMVTGSDRSCNSESDLNDIIKRLKRENRHVFILTCGAFCQGNNIPQLDACVLACNLNSHKKLLQFLGRLLRSRGKSKDKKWFIVMSEKAGSHLHAAISVTDEIKRAQFSEDFKSTEEKARSTMEALPLYNVGRDFDIKQLEVDKRLPDVTKMIIEKLKIDGETLSKCNLMEGVESDTDIGNGRNLSRSDLTLYENSDLGIEGDDISDLKRVKKAKKLTTDRDDQDEVSQDQAVVEDPRLRVIRAKLILELLERQLIRAGRSGDENLKTVEDVHDFIENRHHRISHATYGKKSEVDLSNKQEVLATLKYVRPVDMVSFLAKSCKPFEFDPNFFEEFKSARCKLPA